MLIVSLLYVGDHFGYPTCRYSVCIRHDALQYRFFNDRTHLDISCSTLLTTYLSKVAFRSSRWPVHSGVLCNTPLAF
jgi:hypothetical protein